MFGTKGRGERRDARSDIGAIGNKSGRKVGEERKVGKMQAKKEKQREKQETSTKQERNMQVIEGEGR